jgi:hypothetical protein
MTASLNRVSAVAPAVITVVLISRTESFRAARNRLSGKSVNFRYFSRENVQRAVQARDSPTSF